MTARSHLEKRSFRGWASAALAGCLIGAMVAATAPVALEAAGAQSTISCTFNGKAAPAALTGIVPGKTSIALVCTGKSGLEVASIMASPLGGIVISPASNTNETDIAALTSLKESPAGTYKASFLVPARFSATDRNAVCPPSVGQFNAGLVGCALAVINLATLSQFPGQEAVLETTKQTHAPNSPTLRTATSSATPGEAITFSDATGACPSKPTAASECWWGDALASSSTSASSPALKVTFDGRAVPGATAVVSGPGSGGTGTYNGTTLVPQTLSGSLNLPSPLSNGIHTLTVTQTNVTPFDGNGTKPSHGSPISASTTLIVGPSSGPAVTALHPPSGTSRGGTAVTIKGTNLTGATAVHFGNAAARFTIVSSTSITATSPAGVGAVDVTVTAPSGRSLASNADRFVYVSPTAPVVTGIAPSSGTQLGGTLVAVSGSGFTGAKAVHFGSAAATSFKVISDSELVAKSPNGSGTVDVTVTTKLGTSRKSAADLYSYLAGPAARPAVSAVAPSVGSKGTVVSVTGIGFTDVTAVHFGSVTSGKVTVNSDASITAVAPAETVSGNAVDVTVTTPAGTSATSPADQYTYVGGPVVNSVSPTEGSPVGGYAVTINGSGFTGASAVDFGTKASPSFSVSGDTSITATAPTGTGTVDVTVTTPAGKSAASSANKFAYVAPAVSSVSPNAGSPLGGYPVSITGVGFTGVSAVHFGNAAATDVTVTSDTSLTATAPDGSGTVDVTVTTAGVTSATSSVDRFSYVAVPTVSSVSPAQGPLGGGTVVTISGTSLTGATAVDFGATPATDVTVTSDTSLTATSPAGTATVDVTVTVPSGTSLTTAADQFTYVVAPTVTGVSPSRGPNSGGTTVNITGTGFATATEVDFGAGNSTAFVVNSDTSISVPSSPGAPTAAAGPVDVTVINVGGTSATSSADVFTYEAQPTVTSVSPPAGPPAGGTAVLVTGSGFTPSTTVDFGSTAATDISVISPGLLVATSPAGTGTPDVTVTTAEGTSTTSAADVFTYEVAPTVTSVSPTAGPLGGNVSVTITGTNFTGASEVNFGTRASPSVSVTSPTTIVATAPSVVSPATVHVTVTTPSGTSTTSPADEFSYDVAPTISGVSPSSAPVDVATPVTITGTGFRGTSGVTVAGVAATNVVVVSDTSITAVFPSTSTPAPSPSTVQVTTPGGTGGDGSPSDTFTYTAVVPTITALSLSRNTAAGDSLVTITGTGFTSDATVNFGSNPVTFDTTVNSLTSITVNSPAGTPGTVNVTVTTSGGTSAITPADEFTYLNEKATLVITPSTGNVAGNSVTVTGTGFPTGSWSENESGVLLLQASPLADFLSGFSALNELDTNFLGQPTVDSNGDFTFSFPLADPFSAGDPNAACPPLQSQADAGLVGCAIAGLSLNKTSFLASLADSPVIFAGTQPDPPTLIAPSTVVRVGDSLSFSGRGWWGSFPGGSAAAKICGLRGKPAKCDTLTGSGVVAPVGYSGVGGTLSGATVSGSIRIASNLAGCTSCFLKVTQPNLTPVRGVITASLALTILPPVPAVTAVSPNEGRIAGGTKVTIRGTGLTGTTTVDFGSTLATRVTVKSDTEITAVAPKHAAGIVDVTVSDAGGTSATSAVDGFTYVIAPAVRSVSPDRGPTTGGTKVTIRGIGFSGATGVEFGTIRATSFTVKSDTEITAVAPKHGVGKVNARVASPGGASKTSARDAFTYRK
jgi:hypothetical protein